MVKTIDYANFKLLTTIAQAWDMCELYGLSNYIWYIYILESTPYINSL